MHTSHSNAVETVEGSINTIQQLWDAAAAAHSLGTVDSVAMSNIFNMMSPRLTYQDISDVFSGVYIDTYWNVNFVDATRLCASLKKGVGLDGGLALQYATNSLKLWRGPLLRKNLGDGGAIPVVGDFTAGLDIVCNGDTEAQPVNLIKNWNNPYWSIASVGKNYIYARVHNSFFKDGVTPVTRMFYTSGGVNQPPSSWTQCTTVENNDLTGIVYNIKGEVTALNAGERGCSEAFFFNPTSTDHVCIIATMTSEYFTKNNPLDRSGGNFDAAKWILYNGAATWHNIDPQLQVEDSLSFFNQDKSPEAFNFNLICQNVPVGSTIRMRSDDPALLFDTGNVTVLSPSQVLSHLVTLPPSYAGQLKVTLQDPSGHCLPVHAAAKLSVDWVVSPAHPNYADSAVLASLRQPVSRQPLHLNVGTFTLVGSGRKG